ncbi:MAG TPA: aminodeoxychorismate synthase component I [Pyrinomonadaceae bacterium]
MITALFGSNDKPTDWSGTFSTPTKTFVATRLEEVLPLIESAEREAREGNFVVLLLNYEAAPAFDSALVTHSNGPLPFAWAVVFPEVAPNGDLPPAPFSASEWKPQITKAEYDDSIHKIRELIARGYTYQVNYSFPLTTTFSGGALSYYEHLYRSQGAAYSAYLDLGRYKVLSLSPELFFKRQSDRVWTRPMKGTIKRGRWSEEDRELATRLANSEKDRAENVMIVDLLRNDLGKVSVAGSVKVESLFQLERFETVWQMTSTVESQLKPGTSLVDLLCALFPCGSITGAPKIRTMEIIRNLEPFPRGPYTGTIGLLRSNGDCVFNVAIRTVVIDSETELATFGVGGGITIGSTAEGEYEECLVKAKFLEVEPQQFDLFESLLLEDGEYFLLDRHVERLKRSAEFFGFCFSDADVSETLATLRSAHSSGKWKVKIVLTKTGTLSTEISELGSRGETTLRIALAQSPVDSSDRLRFHKTTARDFYTFELAARPDCDDVIFYNERGEVTESTIANVVVKVNGQLVTPPRTAGLLAGTFRDRLIADGVLTERTITIAELQSADEVFLINSVRKLMRARRI